MIRSQRSLERLFFKEQLFVTLVKDDKGAFIPEGLPRWGFAAGRRARAQLQLQGQMEINSQETGGSGNGKLLRGQVRDGSVSLKPRRGEKMLRMRMRNRSECKRSDPE